MRRSILLRSSVAVLYLILAITSAEQRAPGAELPKPAKVTPPSVAKPADSKPADSKPLRAPSSALRASEESIEALVKRTMKSVVVIRGTGRDGRQDGLGSGFIIDKSGLIVTNLHVIGEGRAFVVETSDGRKLTPIAVHAAERDVDLAIVRVEAQDLPALPLGDSDTVELGQEVVALGNPQGLEHSVVKGVISGNRQIDGLPLIQLAIPIEPGNSGGPVLDRMGRVLGVVTMKSLVTENLGFAVKINALKPLLANPNTVQLDRWMTIGAIDPRKWEPLFGSKWKQRAGRIQVTGAGAGFGGRSLCLAKQDPPVDKFELAVTVKLADEAGAAGLAFASDGNVRHYGFYPTNGRLRLVRFDGSDVYSWNVLGEKASDAYRPGDWNRLKVQVEKDQVRCYVNGALVFEHEMNHPEGVRIGLAKFRDTEAEFKEFAFAAKLVEPTPSAKLVAGVTKLEAALPKSGAASPSLIEPLAREADAGAALLRERAKRLDYEAAQLRTLADALHRRRTIDALSALFAKPDHQIDLLRASLLVARLDNEEVDVEAYLDEVTRMAEEVRGRLKKGADDDAKLAALNKYLFDESGYHGSRHDYYSRSNSYLNEVIDDREGLPITLSVLYIEAGRRLGLPLAGVGVPGHFMVALVSDDNQVRRFLDPFERGATMTEEQVIARSVEIAGRTPEYEQLQPVAKRAVVLRMIENLLNLAVEEKAKTRIAAYLDAILALAPEHMERRMMRAMVRYQSGMIDEAIVDVDYLLEKHGDEIDEERVRELRDRMERDRKTK